MKDGLIIALLFAGGIAAGFEPPNEAQRAAAIGTTDNLSPGLKTTLDPKYYDPIETPEPNDWLGAHEEDGQTFDQFIRTKVNRPDKTRRKIYLLPLGDFPKDQSPPLDALQEYTASFFGLETVVLPAQPLDLKTITNRINSNTKKRQLLADDLLAMLKPKLPEDAFSLIGITMEDLYPDPSWNFVFGMAQPEKRVGAYSFARYDPAFYGEKRTGDTPKLLLRRCCKILSHEITHLFGIKHCIYFRCAINGINHLAEGDSRPMHLCPVCLRKLGNGVGFGVLARYRALERFYKTYGFDGEAVWTEQQIKRISETK